MKFDLILEGSTLKRIIMKIINKQLLILPLYCLIISSFVACSSGKQMSTSATQEEIAQGVKTDRWEFSAQHAMPSYGSSRTITGSYFVRCRKDTLIVALPYYGKVNSPSGASNTNPLDFQSTNIKIEKQEKKPGEWLVTVKPDNPEVQSMAFSFFDNGSAQLNITMTNRSGISYTGKVNPVKGSN